MKEEAGKQLGGVQEGKTNFDIEYEKNLFLIRGK